MSIKAANGIGPGSGPSVRAVVEARARRKAKERARLARIARDGAYLDRLRAFPPSLHESHAANERRAHGGVP